MFVLFFSFAVDLLLFGLKRHPGLYLVDASEDLKEQFPSLNSIARGNFTRQPLGTSYAIQTQGSVSFTLFAKNKEWDRYLYEQLVAPNLHSDLIVETWMNGKESNNDPSFCKNKTIHYNVYNAMHIRFGSDTWPRSKFREILLVLSFLCVLKVVCFQGSLQVGGRRAQSVVLHRRNQPPIVAESARRGHLLQCRAAVSTRLALRRRHRCQCVRHFCDNSGRISAARLQAQEGQEMKKAVAFETKLQFFILHSFHTMRPAAPCPLATDLARLRTRAPRSKSVLLRKCIRT